MFISRLVPMVNVDLLIYDDEGRIMLTWRDEEIHGAGWYVPGGMIRYKETAEERVRATALEELGAEVEFEEAPIFEQITEPERRVRGHQVSLLYKCRLVSAPNQAIRFVAWRAKARPVGMAHAFPRKHDCGSPYPDFSWKAFAPKIVAWRAARTEGKANPVAIPIVPAPWSIYLP
jgi:ADP-ribose pyrophosphatase YjhB (NUDIX family)